MINTDKYEGHSTGWKLKMNCSTATIWNDEGHKVATTHYYDSPSNRHDRFIIEDSLKLLAEVKRLRKQLGKYTQFVLWVESEYNEAFHEYEGKDEL